MSFSSTFKQTLLVCLLLLTFQKISANTDQLYKMEDLEVLKNGKSYEEFFKHAKDVVPSKRTTYWSEMLSSMAMDYVDEKRRLQDYRDETFKKITEIASWPELKRDEFFQIKRNAYNLGHFRTCFVTKKKSECLMRMNEFWKEAFQDLETSYEMAKLHYGFFPNLSGIKYLSSILFQSEDQFYCDRELVKTMFITHLRQSNLAHLEGERKTYYLASLIGESCWNKVMPSVKKEMSVGEPSHQRNLFLALHIKGALNQREYSVWLTRYFLSSPPPGELMNLSWNEIKSMGQDFSKRESVLNELKSLDPLPGDLFKELDGKRAKVLTTYLRDNFPEYLGLYTKECLNYLEGHKVYAHGNPTPECHDLFRSVIKAKNEHTDFSNVIGSPFIDRYEKSVPIQLGLSEKL